MPHGFFLTGRPVMRFSCVAVVAIYDQRSPVYPVYHIISLFFATSAPN